MIVNYDNFLFEQILNESTINEKLDLNQIKEIIKKIGNREEIKNQIIDRINNTKNFLTRKNLITILIVLFAANMLSKNSIFGETHETHISHDIENTALRIAKEKVVSIDNIKQETVNIVKKKKDEPISFNPVPKSNLIKTKIIDLDIANTSSETKDFIKYHEKLTLKAYAIGDDMITIGYGHASPERKSKWKVGDEITIKEAEFLFNIDIKEAESDVKRIIKSWKKPKIENSLTQGMFDALVSMAYNLGATGLKNTNFMNLVKAGKFKDAAEKLKTTKVQSIVKRKDKKTGVYKRVGVEMPGLITRRATEHSFFIKGLI